jgi:thymidylate kinase
MDITFEAFKKRIKVKHKALLHADRYEVMPDSFHKKVLLGFRKIAQQNKNRCILIDADRYGMKQVQNKVLEALLKLG